MPSLWVNIKQTPCHHPTLTVTVTFRWCRIDNSSEFRLADVRATNDNKTKRKSLNFSDITFSIIILGTDKYWWRQTYTSKIRSPFRMPAFCAAPPSSTALTCCNGAYRTPLIDFSTPPSLIWPRTLKPKPVEVFVIVTILGPGSACCFSEGEGELSSSLSAIVVTWRPDGFAICNWLSPLNTHTRTDLSLSESVTGVCVCVCVCVCVFKPSISGA